MQARTQQSELITVPVGDSTVDFKSSESLQLLGFHNINICNCLLLITNTYLFCLKRIAYSLHFRKESSYS